ncbi:MAG: hypothetical protein ACUZ8H_08565 [Candidatus Anammoxibacter sp.]
MKRIKTPEIKVGKTANLIIFIGILYSILSLLALTVCHFFMQRGYGVTSLIIGIIIIALGYGIRYGKTTCLYAATGIFTAVSAYFLFNIIIGRHVFMSVRLVFSIWVLSSLVRAIPKMIKLKAAGSSPDRNSKYKDFFLRRKKKS